MAEKPEPLAWWNGLRHQGMLIAPAVLAEVFPHGDSPLPDCQYERLRDRYTALLARVQEAEAGEGVPADAVRDWLDALVTGPLGHRRDCWIKQDRLPEQYTARTPGGERLRPDRLLLRPDGQPALLVCVDESRRLGVGRSKAQYARLLALLRGTGVKLGLLTNGLQFRLCYAGLDHDAWAEWEAEAWFAGAETRGQLGGFVYLLGPAGIHARNGLEYPLLHAVESSRTRQGELAQVLGEQVRRGVELLLEHLSGVTERRPDLVATLAADPATGRALPEPEQLRALYQAATRLVMRLVVVLYAEARDLLPRGTAVYYQSYSVEQLFTNLQKAWKLERGALQEQRGAWQQLLALFRLIHEGSAHPDLPVREYGGQLFARGDAADPDPVRRALALFEAPEYELDDLQVYELLRLLKMGRVRVRQGRSQRWLTGPVDFSDLRTEYIGIMYQGLLDYELRRVGAEPVVFLGVGQEPALPLPLLEGLHDRALKDLLQKLAKEGAGDSSGDEDGEGEAAGAAAADAAEPAEPEGAADELPEHQAEEAEAEEQRDQTLHQRALAWARRAVELAGMVRRPRGRGPDPLYERRREEAAHRLVRRVLGPGALYLVRWGGTRKGSGTFYTRPQLSVPLTHRTLMPLCYETLPDGSRQPRPPEAILALKVVDPAMGSGSFLVAALNYLTDALAASLQAHGRVQPRGEETAILLLGGPASGREPDELLPCRPDDPRFDDLLRARLKRHVVERCLYGVDINPLAAELARLSLWIETMDRELPFEFLDHKLKVGNSLVGCWLHRFEDYPALAWARDGGDKQHDGVHHPKGARTKRIKEIFEKQIKPALVEWVMARPLYGLRGEQARQALAALRERFGALHALQKHEAEREEFYRREIMESPEYQELRAAMDRWCAVWFWPVDGRVPPLTPRLFDEPTPEVEEVVAELRQRHRFFHWELEFPEVFTPERSGFDAVLGNPPWDIQKPNSLEFFSQYDPIYRTYGKQEALQEQKRIFRDLPAAEAAWLDYQDGFRALSNWVGNVAEPFEVSLGRGARGEELRAGWKRARDGRPALVDRELPFCQQGGADLNTYKLFLEMAHHVLCTGGRLGFVVPAGLYSDKGCGSLRRLFVERSGWEALVAVQNERFIFSGVAHNVRFAIILVTKGAAINTLETVFRVTVSAAPTADELPFLVLGLEGQSTPLPFTWIRKVSGQGLAIPTLRDHYDKVILDKLFSNTRPLVEAAESWGASFATEFHMTGDSDLFVSRDSLEQQGVLLRTDDMRNPTTRAKLLRAGFVPLYEGKHINQMDAYFGGDFRYLIPVREKKLTSWQQLVWREIARATDSRTLIATHVTAGAYGHTLWTVSGMPIRHLRRLSTLMNSFVVDYYVRLTLSGAHVLLSTLANVPVPDFTSESPIWTLVDTIVEERSWLGLDPTSRLWCRCALDALVAQLYGLTEDEFAKVLTMFPAVDKHLPPQDRQTALALSAFAQLQSRGLAEFARLDWIQEITPTAHPGIAAWAPPGGWAAAWAEARAMLNDQEWAMLTGQAPPIPAAEMAKAAAGEQRESGGGGQLKFDL